MIYNSIYVFSSLLFNLYYLFFNFPKGKYANLVSSIICLWLEGNISSSVKYLYLSIIPDYAVSLLIWYCTFSSIILLSIVMISFYILSTRFFLKCKELSYASVAPINKEEYALTHKVIKSISDEWLNPICWSSHLFGIFIIK